MYSAHPHFVIGFHGCDQTVANSVVARHSTHLIASKNKWDWLGHGIYFWEQNHQRALDWAQYLKSNPRKMSPGKTPIKTPGAVGSVIDLGHCLNLLDGKYIDLVEGTYERLKKIFDAAKIPLPKNTKDARNLDCAVINAIHMFRKASGEKPFDTVRGMFPEGDPLYKNAGFQKQNHIQLCVINPNCVKGYFHPLAPDAKYPLP
jgi:hypothetical protein